MSAQFTERSERKLYARIYPEPRRGEGSMGRVKHEF